MSHKPLFAFLALAVICLVSAGQAKADPLIITFTNPNQSGTPGSTLFYTGVVTNSGPVSVNVPTGGITFVGGADLGRFFFPETFLDFLPLTLAPGQSTGEIALAAFTFHPGYDGPFPATEFVIFDLSTNFIIDFVGGQTFSATVVAPQAVPEPVTVLLFGTGLAAVAARARGKRRDRTKPHA
jgi:hypothetical protein